jgi:uncharacterized protein (DUF2141 family)
MRTALVIWTAALVAACATSSEPANPSVVAAARRAAQGDLDLTVEVRGLRSSDGNVLVALFTSERGFPGDAAQAVRIETQPLQQRAAEVRFRGLSPGSYAIAVLHDENGNGKLDTGFLGIPSEGLGASRDAQGRFGPADFEDAKLQLVESGAVEIRLRYFP